MLFNVIKSSECLSRGWWHVRYGKWPLLTSTSWELRSWPLEMDRGLLSSADTMENIQEWEEAGWEEWWQWLWCDTDGCWEGGMRRLVTPRWWADDISSWEELGTVTRCHTVNIIDSPKDGMINIDYRSSSKTGNFGKMSWWCWVTSVFCGYQNTIIELIFPLSSVFCWLSNVTLWCTDNGRDGGFLTLRLGENSRESLLQDDDIWWVGNGDGSYVSRRSPTVPWLLFLQRRKMGSVITMGEGELWVNIMKASLLTRDRWPPEEFDLKYFWWKLFCMNQVLSHIIARNETMEDRGAVTLGWSMGEWTELITSRVVLLQT